MISGKPKTNQIFHPKVETSLSRKAPIKGSEIISTILDSIIARPVSAIPTVGITEKMGGIKIYTINWADVMGIDGRL